MEFEFSRIQKNIDRAIVELIEKYQTLPGTDTGSHFLWSYKLCSPRIGMKCLRAFCYESTAPDAWKLADLATGVHLYIIGESFLLGTPIPEFAGHAL